MISKELLSEVLGCNIKDIYKINSNPNFGNNELVYSISGVGDILSINIHQLAHKCKEWAFNKNEDISIYRMRGFLKPTYSVSVMIKDRDGRSEKWKRLEDAETEPEAIFKACDYILNKLSNK